MVLHPRVIPASAWLLAAVLLIPAHSGAKPGIIMEVDPQTGDSYFQEFAESVAQDMAQVMSTTSSETVPQGTHADVLETKEWSPIETGSIEFKAYAPGVGLILERKGNQ